jgi:hypothetical protein
VAVLLAIRIGQLEREKAAVETVRQLGGTVMYGKETFAPDWFQGLMPARVVSVNLAGTRTTNSDLAILKSLTWLEKLDLDRTPIASGALEPLAGLARLQTLSLEATGIGDDDFAQLAGLTKLTMLKLGGTQVSDAGLDYLDALLELENLSISDTKITVAGLAKLRTFERLQQLWIDESQVSRDSAAHLQALPSLKRVAVHVPRGTGKRARDVLAPLSGIDVSAFRRVPEATASKSAQPGESRLWDGATPWEATTSGVVEMILAKVLLQPEDSERLVNVLAEARPAGDWRRQEFGFGSPPVAAVPKREPIKNNEEFLRALKKGDPNDFVRALVYVRTGAAGAAVPALLEFLKSPDETLRRRTVTVLVRIGLSDMQVVAAIRGMLRAYDMDERVRTVYAFDVSHWRWRYVDIVPQFGGASDWRWRYGDIVPQLGAAEAKVAVSLLLEVSEDEYSVVRSGIAEALPSIVKEHPQEAERVVPFLLKTLNDSDGRVRHAAPYALGTIAEASPGRARGIVQRLIGMLQDEPGEVRWDIVEALQHIAPQSAETAHAAVPALLRLLRDKNLTPGLRWAAQTSAATPPPVATGQNRRQFEGAAVPGALGRIVENHPEHVKQIVPAVLPLLDDEDPWIKFTASVTLSSVAAGIAERSARQYAAGERSAKDPRP